jgi:hypothetical protein
MFSLVATVVKISKHYLTPAPWRINRELDNMLRVNNVAQLATWSKGKYKARAERSDGDNMTMKGVTRSFDAAFFHGDVQSLVPGSPFRENNNARMRGTAHHGSIHE